MVTRSAQADEDALKVQQCVEGNPEALTFLQNKYYLLLRSLLVARGANLAEAEDLLADLWGDCVAGPEERPSLLEKYSDKCPVKAWLVTVATHRLLDFKRRQKLRNGGRVQNQLKSVGSFSAPVATPPMAAEGALVQLLQESLQHAFSYCAAGELLMLRLVYLHGLRQREIGRMWGWHESKVSRCLSRAMRQIEANTLQRIKQTDPWLELTWQDFLDLCHTRQIGFL
jgi:RNA polymerase sigma factor (sigma-70 family)